MRQYEDDAMMHVANLRIEAFAVDFEESGKAIMNKLGIMEPTDRAMLVSKFKTYDLSSLSARQLKQRSHVMQGKFDKQHQLSVLLSDTQRCSRLKEQSAQLEYMWDFTEFC